MTWGPMGRSSDYPDNEISEDSRCSNCKWLAGANQSTGLGTCRRVAWGDTGTQFGFGCVDIGWAACPAYVDTEGDRR